MKYSAMLVAAGVLSAGTAFAQQGPIKIGVLYPLTGGGAVYGVPAMVGHQLAVEELNAKGGIDAGWRPDFTLWQRDFFTGHYPQQTPAFGDSSGRFRFSKTPFWPMEIPALKMPSQWGHSARYVVTNEGTRAGRIQFLQPFQRQKRLSFAVSVSARQLWAAASAGRPCFGGRSASGSV